MVGGEFRIVQPLLSLHIITVFLHSLFISGSSKENESYILCHYLRVPHELYKQYWTAHLSHKPSRANIIDPFLSPLAGWVFVFVCTSFVFRAHSVQKLVPSQLENAHNSWTQHCRANCGPWFIVFLESLQGKITLTFDSDWQLSRLK